MYTDSIWYKFIYEALKWSTKNDRHDNKNMYVHIFYTFLFYTKWMIYSHVHRNIPILGTLYKTAMTNLISIHVLNTSYDLQYLREWNVMNSVSCFPMKFDAGEISEGSVDLSSFRSWSSAAQFSPSTATRSGQFG